MRAGPYGDAANFATTLNLGPNVQVSQLGWDVTITSYSGARIDASSVEFLTQDLADGVNGTPGYDNAATSGTYIYNQPPINLVDLALDFSVAADGILYISLFHQESGKYTLWSGSLYVVTPGDGSSNSDPIITGFDGRVFEFKGVPDRVFNMFSIEDFQVNSLFINANSGTYTGAVGIMQGGVNFIKFDLDGVYLYGENATLNGEFGLVKRIIYPMDPMQIANGGVITRPSKGTLEIDWPMYHVHIKRIYEVPAGKDEFVYIDLVITTKMGGVEKDDVHGVIGQTMVNSVVGYEGTWEDYAGPEGNDNVFTLEFPNQFFKYDPASSKIYTEGDTQKAHMLRYDSSNTGPFSKHVPQSAV